MFHCQKDIVKKIFTAMDIITLQGGINVSKEKVIESSTWVILAFLLVLLVPKNKIRHAIVSFLFAQSITWVAGLFVVEKKLIRYPRRFFRTYKASFTFEFFAFPTISVFLNIFYPEKRSQFFRALYYSFYLTFITVTECIVVRYTKNINYINWKWYWSTLTMGLCLYIFRLYYKWFFNKELNNVGYIQSTDFNRTAT